MADNLTLNSGSGGATLATDDITDADGAHYQRVKLTDGTANSTTHIHAGGGVEANALRVTIANDSTGVVSVDDNGGSLTVDGTVTANLSATDNTVLDNIDTNTDYGQVVGGGAEATALRVTLANDSTGVVSVDDNGGSITVDNGGTFATQATLQANSGVDIGDVDVTSVIPGTGATNLGKAEDAAHTTGDTGVMALGVRNDNLAALAGADGDYAPLQVNAEGALFSTLAGVQSSGNSSTTPLGSGATFTGTGEQNEYPDVMVSCQQDNTGTLYFDFSVDGTNWSTFPVNGFAVASGTHEFHTAVKGPRYFRVRFVNDAGSPTYLRLYTYYGTFAKLPNAPLNQSIAADADSVITTSVIAANNGSNYVNVGATAGGNLKISLQEASDGLDIGAGNAGTETLRVSISTDDVNLSGILADTASMDTNLATVAGDTTSLDGKLPAAGALSDNFANPTTTQIGSMSMVWDGSTWDRMPGTSADGVTVNLGSNNDVTVTGTVTVDLGANNDVTVTGGNAHDGATLGNPVLGGARATNSVEGITQVANADLTHIQADLNGVLLSRPHTTLEEIISERVSDTAGNSTNFTNFAAGGAGVHNYVTTISIFNSSATDGYVDFRDGSAGSIIFTAPAPAASGSVINLPVPLKGAANTALAYDVSGALSTVYISIVGFQAQG